MKLFKNIHLIPSIRPKCGTDKNGFLNNVYTKGTREKKLQLDAPQSGRSMIEMLGVLAIIGVLSVGAIAGYSKAMMKVKINKLISYTEQIYANVTTLFGEKDIKSIGFFPSEGIMKMIIPDDMFSQESLSSPSSTGYVGLTHPFCKKEVCVHIFYAGESRFGIKYYNLPPEVCVALGFYVQKENIYHFKVQGKNMVTTSLGSELNATNINYVCQTDEITSVELIFEI